VRALSFALVVVVAIELAVWECFLVAARPFGHALPVAAVVVLVANPVLGVTGARAVGARWGSAVPGLVWLGIALTFASGCGGDDCVVPNSGRALSFLLVGTVSAAAVVGVTGSRSARNASPGPVERR
jgi:hypothetical protein